MYSSPAFIDFVSCDKPVRNCFDRHDRRVIETKCSFPAGHAGPCARVYYESVSYENAEKPNRSKMSDSDLIEVLRGITTSTSGNPIQEGDTT